MISKEISYGRVTRSQVTAQTGVKQPAFFLFDGCHRFDITTKFLNGEVYVKISNDDDEDDENFVYAWNTLEAVERAKRDNPKHAHKHCLILPEWTSSLMTCPVSMITLDRSFDDAYAYERAKVANLSKKLTNAQIMKALCARKTTMATLLNDISAPNDGLSSFLGDEQYRFIVSILRMFHVNGLACDYALCKIALVQGENAIKTANNLVLSQDNPLDSIFCDKTLDATTKARSIINDVLEENPKPHGSPNAVLSAIGLVFFSLSLAISNVNEGLYSSLHITKENVAWMLTSYLALDKSEKGMNHGRMFSFFTTGKFPSLEEATASTKRRKRSHAEVGDDYGGSSGAGSSSNVVDV